MFTEAAAVAEATEDVPKPKRDKMVYGCFGHPCNGKEFLCEFIPTSCHNCGGPSIQFLRWE